MRVLTRLLLALILIVAPLSAQENISGDELIAKIDANQSKLVFKYRAVMKIKNNNRTLTKEMQGAGKDNGALSFIQFTNSEDKGVKYLKRDDELWIYFPDADDIMKISGHMLKKGMMGSDISYEDMLETETNTKKYKATVLSTKEYNGTSCFELLLDAIDSSARYEKKMLLVDQNSFVPIKIELYARGGRLIKEIEQSDIRTVNGKKMAFKSVIRDRRKENSETTLEFLEIVDGAKLPEDIFTKSRLRK